MQKGIAIWYWKCFAISIFFIYIKKSLFVLSLTLYLLHEGHCGQMRNQCWLKYKSEMKKVYINLLQYISEYVCQN